MKNIVGVSFTNKGKIYNFSPQDLSLEVGEKVIVETENEHEKSRRYYYANREKILAKLRAKTDEKRRLDGLVNDTDIVTNG